MCTVNRAIISLRILVLATSLGYGWLAFRPTLFILHILCVLIRLVARARWDTFTTLLLATVEPWINLLLLASRYLHAGSALIAAVS